MISLLEFYSNLGLDICKRADDYFTGQLINEEGTMLSVIHTGNTHRLNCEKNGMHCQIIPNSKIEVTDVDLVVKILSISVFLNSNFPNIYQKVLLSNTEPIE